MTAEETIRAHAVMAQRLLDLDAACESGRAVLERAMEGLTDPYLHVREAHRILTDALNGRTGVRS